MSNTEQDYVKVARENHDDLLDALDGHDVVAVTKLREQARQLNPKNVVWGHASLDLSPTEWVTVLETVGSGLYITVSDRTDDFDVTWYVRHDGTEWVYATERMGEMYRGDRDSNAFRQVSAVLENDAPNRPRSMSTYPLEFDHGIVWTSDV